MHNRRNHFNRNRGESSQKKDSASKVSSFADMKTDLMKNILKNSMAAAFGDDCSVSLDGVIFTVGAWQDGIAMTAFMAKSGDPEAARLWNQMRTVTVTAANHLQDILRDNGLNDHLVVVNVLNDTNPDNILLTVTAGTVLADAAG